MRKILYLCLLLTLNTECFAAAAGDESAEPGILTRLCSCFSFNPDPTEAAPATRKVSPKKAAFEEALKKPETLEEAVHTWRTCRARNLIGMRPENGPSIDDIYEAEDAARDFISSEISDLNSEQKSWLQTQILTTDPVNGLAIFPKLFRG